jgi:phage-related protein
MKIEKIIYAFTFRIYEGEKMIFEILAFIGGLIYSAATAIGMFITVIILVVIFIIGTFIGDLLEVAIKK